jgi:hypothetical protein
MKIIFDKYLKIAELDIKGNYTYKLFISCLFSIIIIFGAIGIFFIGLILTILSLFYPIYKLTLKSDEDYLKNANKYLNFYGKCLLFFKGKYYLENYEHDKNLLLDEFIINFIHINNNIYNTKKNFLYFIQIEVCGITKRRSLGDIFLICKYYYPNCKINDVLKILYENTSYSRCNEIQKIVFYNNGYKNNDHKIEYFGENITLKQLIENLK